MIQFGDIIQDDESVFSKQFTTEEPVAVELEPIEGVTATCETDHFICVDIHHVDEQLRKALDSQELSDEEIVDEYDIEDTEAFREQGASFIQQVESQDVDPEQAVEINNSRVVISNEQWVEGPHCIFVDEGDFTDAMDSFKNRYL